MHSPGETQSSAALFQAPTVVLTGHRCCTVDSREALANVTCGDNNLVFSIPLSIHPVVQTFLSHGYTVGTDVLLVTCSDPSVSLQAGVFSHAGCLSWKGHLN